MRKLAGTFADQHSRVKTITNTFTTKYDFCLRKCIMAACRTSFALFEKHMNYILYS
jgi:hypothetical protein